MAESSLKLLLEAQDNLSSVLTSVRQEMTALQQEIARLRGEDVQFGDEFSDAADSAGDLKDEVEGAAEDAEGLGDEAGRTGEEFEGAAEDAEGFSDSLKLAKTEMIAVGAAVAAVVASVVKMTSEFKELNTAVTEVQTLVDRTQVSNQELQDTVIDLSNEFGTRATDVAKGLYQAISAGAAQGSEANELLSVAIRTARGGVTDTLTAVDGLTTVINAFGKDMGDAENVADVLFTTMKGGKTTIDELSASIFQAAPFANALGVSFEELSAGVRGLTLGGTRTAQAMTQLRAALQGITRPTEELNAIFRSAGFESAQASIEAQGLAETFNLIQEASGGNIGTLTKLVGSVEGVNAILGLTGENADLFADGMRDIENAAGAMNEAFETVEQSFSQRVSTAIVRIQNLLIAVGQLFAPLVGTIIEAFGEMAVVIGDFINDNRAVLTVLTSVVTILAAITGAVVAGVIAWKAFSLTLTAVNVGIRAAAINFRAFRAESALFQGIGAGISQSFTRVKDTLIEAGKSIRTMNTAFLRSPAIIPGVIAGATALVAQFFIMNDEMEKTSRELDEMNERLRLSLGADKVRSANSLVQAIQSIGAATGENARALREEAETRLRIIEGQIDGLQRQREATSGVIADTAKFFGLMSENENEDNAIAVLKAQANDLRNAMGSLSTVTEETNDAMEDVDKTVKSVGASIEATDSAIGNFIGDLETIKNFRFDQVLRQLDEEEQTRRAILQAAGASERTLFDTQLAFSQQRIALKEREVSELAGLESERVRRQRELLSQQAENETELAESIQALGAESVSRQIQLATDLVAIREDAISKTRESLNQVVSDAITSRQRLADVLQGIDDQIADIQRSELGDLERRNQLQIEADRSLAQARLAIEEGRFQEAQEQAERFAQFIQQQKFVPEADSGIQLETEEAVNADTIRALRQLKELQIDITEGRERDAQLREREGQAFIVEKENEISALQRQIQTLQTTSATINLSTNVGEIQSALRAVQSQLSGLSGRQVPLEFQLEGEATRDVFRVLGTNSLTISTNFTGLQSLTDAAQEFEQANRNILSDLRLLVSEIRSLSSTVPATAGFATGGQVVGPGTGRSDSILARLSNGEYVISSAAVEKYGSGLFAALNSMSLPKFASGGLVESVGGQDGGRDIVDIRLSFGNQLFNLQGERGTAKNLSKSLRRLSRGTVGG